MRDKIERFLIYFVITAIVFIAGSVAFVNPNRNEVVFGLDDGHWVYFKELNSDLFEIRDNFSGMEYGQRFSKQQMDEMSQQFGWQQIRPNPEPPSSSFFFSTAYAAEKKTVELFIDKTEHRVNGALVKSDAAPFIQQGRTMVPLRFVGESFGFEVEWIPLEEKIVVSYESTGDEVVLSIGSRTIIANGTRCSIDVPPQIVGGRTFIPIRAVVEVFGANIADIQQNRHPTLGYPMGVSKVTIEMLY
jgi:hypothetical protein